MSSSVETELLKATKQKKKGKSEATQDYLNRVFDAVQELEDSDWDDLSEAAQLWANEAAKLKKKKGKSLPDFPADEAEEEEEESEEDEDGEEEEESEEDEDEDEDEEEEDTKKKSSKKPASKKDDKPAKSAKKDDKKKDDKPAKAAKDEKKPAAPRKSGVTVVIKKLILKKPDISQEDLIAELEEKGHGPVSAMTVSTVRADMRQSLAVMHEVGVLSDAMAKKMDKTSKK